MRFVWDGTPMVGRSEQVRVGAGESWETACESGSTRSKIHSTTERRGWNVGAREPCEGGLVD